MSEQSDIQPGDIVRYELDEDSTLLSKGRSDWLGLWRVVGAPHHDGIALRVQAIPIIVEGGRTAKARPRCSRLTIVQRSSK